MGYETGGVVVVVVVLERGLFDGWVFQPIRVVKAPSDFVGEGGGEGEGENRTKIKAWGKPR